MKLKVMDLRPRAGVVLILDVFPQELDELGAIDPGLIGKDAIECSDQRAADLLLRVAAMSYKSATRREG